MAARTGTPSLMESIGSLAKGALETVSKLPGKVVDAFRGGIKKRAMQAMAVASVAGACTPNQICDARADRFRDEYTSGIDSYATLAALIDYMYGEIGGPNIGDSRKQMVCTPRENEEYYLMPMGTPAVPYILETDLDKEKPPIQAAGLGYRLVRRDDPRVFWVDGHDDDPRLDFAESDIDGFGLPNDLGFDPTYPGSRPDGLTRDLLPVDFFFGGQEMRDVNDYMDQNVPVEARVWVRFNFSNGRELIDPSNATFWFIGDRATVVQDGDDYPAQTFALGDGAVSNAIVMY